MTCIVFIKHSWNFHSLYTLLFYEPLVVILLASIAYSGLF